MNEYDGWVTVGSTNKWRSCWLPNRIIDKTLLTTARSISQLPGSITWLINRPFVSPFLGLHISDWRALFGAAAKVTGAGWTYICSNRLARVFISAICPFDTRILYSCLFFVFPYISGVHVMSKKLRIYVNVNYPRLGLAAQVLTRYFIHLEVANKAVNQITQIASERR
jgi:hypothetical protein